MKRSVRNEWVRRLRSGDYKQGAEKLCKDGQYCCLGVLAEQAGLLVDIGRGAKAIPEHERDGEATEAEEAEFPWHIRERLGLSKPLHDKLIAMNDQTEEIDEVGMVHMNPFETIADYIQNNVPVEDDV